MTGKILGFLLFGLFICMSMSYGNMILDQAHELSIAPGIMAESISNDILVWQEFTPTMDSLGQVDLLLERSSLPYEAVVSFEIRKDSSIIWDTSFSSHIIPYGEEVWFEVAIPNITLIPEETYQLCLTSTLTPEENSGNLVWWGAIDDPYSRGDSSFSVYSRTPFDFGFRTWVVPEPATVSLLALGGLALLRKRK
jgi:hypothetical protein